MPKWRDDHWQHSSQHRDDGQNKKICGGMTATI